MHGNGFVPFVTLLNFECDVDGIRSVQVLRIVLDEFALGEESDVSETKNFGSFLVLRGWGGKIFTGSHDEEEGDDG